MSPRSNQSRLAVRRLPLLIRVALGLFGGVVLALSAATAASAHVRVSGTDTARGGYGVLTFRVPTESATASTTALSITLPKDTPIVSASTQPMPGWKATVSTAKLDQPIKTDDGEVDSYVAKVTWTATSKDAEIAPGQFQQFNLSVGPLPDQSEVSFPALQTYSDGTTVNWNQASSGGAEPEHPAPVLALAAAAPSAAADPSAEPSAGSFTSGSTPNSTPASGPRTSAGDGTGAGAGLATCIVGIALGVAAGIIAVVALLRGQRGARSGERGGGPASA